MSGLESIFVMSSATTALASTHQQKNTATTTTKKNVKQSKECASVSLSASVEQENTCPSDETTLGWWQSSSLFILVYQLSTYHIHGLSLHVSKTSKRIVKKVVSRDWIKRTCERAMDPNKFPAGWTRVLLCQDKKGSSQWKIQNENWFPCKRWWSTHTCQLINLLLN